MFGLGVLFSVWPKQSGGESQKTDCGSPLGLPGSACSSKVANAATAPAGAARTPCHPTLPSAFDLVCPTTVRCRALFPLAGVGIEGLYSSSSPSGDDGGDTDAPDDDGAHGVLPEDASLFFHRVPYQWNRQQEADS